MKTCQRRGRPTLTSVRRLVHTDFTGVLGEISPWLLFCSGSFWILILHSVCIIWFSLYWHVQTVQRSQALFYQLYHMQLSSHGFLKELGFFFFSHPAADLVKGIGFCHEVVRGALCRLWFTLAPTEPCGRRSPSESQCQPELSSSQTGTFHLQKHIKQLSSPQEIMSSHAPESTSCFSGN